MSSSAIKDLAASVRQRLFNLSRERRQPFDIVLTRYAIERLLYRLSRSKYSNDFVLKGATLFAIWTEEIHRPTRDLDLLAFGEASAERLRATFKELCTLDVEPDGLRLDPETIRVMEIRGAQEYPGQRVQLIAKLGSARIPVQVDVGFGDAVVPVPEEVEYPTMLSFPPPRLKAYPKEAVVAEKLHTMVVLGIANSRMRDFYDIWTMSRLFLFDGETLSQAIRATFERRRTEIPSTIPLALTSEFATDLDKRAQWRGFLHRSGLGNDTVDERGSGNGRPTHELERVIDDLKGFLLPPLAVVGEGVNFDKTWPPKGPWMESKAE